MLFLIAVLSIYRMEKKTTVLAPANAQPHIVIDAGHGGSDPGKVGINQALEKDINLAIALYLKQYFQSYGCYVALTRETDTSLAAPSASNQKLSDFKERAKFIEQSAPAVVISIHQNSYPDESVHGCQVFYPPDKESNLLASSIQNHCQRVLDPENHRQEKENNSYYLFRHTDCPVVIVECGFLSNHKEANLLITTEYQQKTAWSIFMGTIQFLKKIDQ